MNRITRWTVSNAWNLQGIVLHVSRMPQFTWEVRPVIQTPQLTHWSGRRRLRITMTNSFTEKPKYHNKIQTQYLKKSTYCYLLYNIYIYAFDHFLFSTIKYIQNWTVILTLFVIYFSFFLFIIPPYVYYKKTELLLYPCCLDYVVSQNLLLKSRVMYICHY